MQGLDVSYFMQKTEQLWSPETGYPTLAETPATEGSDQRLHGYKGKLRGKFSWSFSIELPRSIEWKRGEAAEYSMPASFLQRQSRVSVNYRISATVVRGVLATPYM